MPRTRTIPDATVLATVRQLLADGGEKAVSFATVAAATGLAPPTLAQRYGSRDGMVKAARLAAWDDLCARTDDAINATATKGPQGLLKAIGPVNAAAIALDLRSRPSPARRRLACHG
jgi:AcrR family transcriptional regulator